MNSKLLSPLSLIKSNLSTLQGAKRTPFQLIHIRLNNYGIPIQHTYIQRSRNFNLAHCAILLKSHYSTQNQKPRNEILANKYKNNPEKQAQYLQQLLEQKEYQTIIRRVKSGIYATDDKVIKIYDTAKERLARVNRYDDRGARNTPENQLSGYTDSKPLSVSIVTEGGWGKKFREMIFSIFKFLAIAAAVLLILQYSQSNVDSSRVLGIKTTPKRSKSSAVTFADVKGADESKEELQEIVDFLRDPQKFKLLGAKCPKGLLLVGSPGTGKTLLARAVAGEANVPFFYCTGSEFDEVFVGVGPRRIRNLFAEAKKNSPSIIFIDEIDSVGTSRKRTIQSYRESTLNQLLTEIDGFEQDTKVIVIGATNFPESLDPALTRPGRFDKIVPVPLPDLNGRQQILDLYLKKIKTGEDVSSLRLARATPGLTGADLFNIVNLSAIKAARLNKSAVDMRLLEEAYDDVTMGVERRSTIIPEDNRRVTAYHEGGHALVAYYTEGSHPIRKATIIPRGMALGLVSQMPEKDTFSVSKKQLISQIAVAMGGRAAEEFILGSDDVTTGASSDFQQAKRIATLMVTEYGMSEKVGNIYLKSSDKSFLSDETMKLIDSEIQNLINTQYKYAKQLLKTHEHQLHNLAKALLEYETLTGEEVHCILSGQPIMRKVDEPIVQLS
eukprot:TRINITY_DN4877_c0_g1_i1.p1 TRINITY_DN4877_c0_g1~~TRINITY_DN4877_c0_g1_i1.p1  ORF type:complete len:668 (+),score=128.47 TRINITY_DN4877_c0_g1_i1:46-2049(+)